MNKLRIFAMTALAAAAIGVGGLVATPSASAMPAPGECTALLTRANMYLNLQTVASAAGYYGLARSYGAWANDYFSRAEECLLK